jgi:lipopolysaccharide transport system permease protein/teichoic acid transport system permease protein
MVILIVLLFKYDISFSVYNLQFLYYLAALTIFSLGLGWLCSALNVFYRDTAQIVGVLFNIWFWLTPIVWEMNIVPEKYSFYVKLNPFYYIVQGYKDSFLYHIPFWEHYMQGIYFWVVCFLTFAIGAFVFKKLKPDFVDVM